MSDGRDPMFWKYSQMYISNEYALVFVFFRCVETSVDMARAARAQLCAFDDAVLLCSHLAGWMPETLRMRASVPGVAKRVREKSEISALGVTLRLSKRESPELWCECEPPISLHATFSYPKILTLYSAKTLSPSQLA